MKRIEYSSGQILGENIIFLKEDLSSPKKRIGHFKCYCGNYFTTTIDAVKRRKCRSCGCLNSKLSAERTTTHGISKHKLFGIWSSIKYRCYNPKHKSFNNYGGRGIVIANEWINDPESFINYIETLNHCGEEGFTLDRIDNDGNYVIGNLRFATRSQQNMNTRNKKSNTTGVRGVSFRKDRGNYQGTYQLNGKTIRKSGFTSIEDAQQWRIKKLYKMGKFPLQLNVKL